MVNRRQSLQNRHSKKTKVAAAAAGTATNAAMASGSVTPTPGAAAGSGSVATPSASTNAKDRESKCPKKGSGRTKRKHKGAAGCDDDSKNGTGHQESSGEAEADGSGCGKQLSGKVAIPRLPHNRSPRPSSTSTILLLPSQSTSNSPTALSTVGKPKFVPIQPKPCENGTGHGTSSACLPQLKEEEDSGVARTGPGLPDWDGGLHGEELANYWSQPGGDNSVDCPSPKVQTHQAQQELSQLRVLLEQNEGEFLIRRMQFVRFSCFTLFQNCLQLKPRSRQADCWSAGTFASRHRSLNKWAEGYSVTAAG